MQGRDRDRSTPLADGVKQGQLGAVIGVVAAFLYGSLFLALTSLFRGFPVRGDQWLAILVLAPGYWLLFCWWIPASVGCLLGLALAGNARKHAGRPATLRTLGLGAAAGVLVAIAVTLVNHVLPHFRPNVVVFNWSKFWLWTLMTIAYFAVTMAPFCAFVAWLWARALCRPAASPCAPG